MAATVSSRGCATSRILSLQDNLPQLYKDAYKTCPEIIPMQTESDAELTAHSLSPHLLTKLSLLAGDIKNLTRGSKVYFPVFVEGTLPASFCLLLCSRILMCLRLT